MPVTAHRLGGDLALGPVALALTLGNVADITVAVPLLDPVCHPKRLIADKVCDTEQLRTRLKRDRRNAMTSPTAGRIVPYVLDRRAYKRRTVIERLFCGSSVRNASRIYIVVLHAYSCPAPLLTLL